jgi:hypothetical protein
VALDKRDPETLGRLLRETRKLRPEMSMSEIAAAVDLGVMGESFCHPSVLNGRSRERVPPDAFRR